MYYVTDIQAVEPDELFRNKPRAVAVTVEDGLDSMGFNRVTLEAPTKTEIITFVVGNWGDDDPAWIDEWIIDRIKAS